MVRLALYRAFHFAFWFLLPLTSSHLSLTSGAGSDSEDEVTDSLPNRIWGAVNPARREQVLRYQVRRLIQKHLALHFLNLTPRDGVAQLPWVKRYGVRAGAESVQGHVGSTRHLANDFAKRLGWPQRKIARLLEMIEYHELDEWGAPDVSLWSMDQKRDPQWRPITCEQWYEQRRRGYFEDGGRERVSAFLEKFPTSDRNRVQGLCDEFYEAKTDVALLANQLDDFQAVMEAAARYLSFLSSMRIGAKTIADARWNFFDSYLPQGEQIMEDPILIIALRLLTEEVERAEELHQIPPRERKVLDS